jgi:predicted nucleotide-binding protein
MPFHVMIWPRSSEQQKLHELYALNVEEDELRQRLIEPYEKGLPITWSGRTLPAGDFGTIKITHTEQPQHVPDFEEYEVVKRGRDVTDEWIKGPPGESRAEVIREEVTADRDPKRVMVVHGRNQAARNAMFAFLRSIGLEPIEWEEAVAETGMGSPHNLEAVRSAMDVGQAVVVILTAEDQAGLLPTLAENGEDISLKGQPRQNVILEAGLAMGLNPDRTILVEIGPIRRASDFEGLNAIRLTNDAPRRGALRTRLRTAGCKVADGGTDWLSPETGGDFDTYVPAETRQPVPTNQTRAVDNPYAQAIALQREMRLNQFLDKYVGVDQPFSSMDLAEGMEERDCDEAWAEATLENLKDEGRVCRDQSGTGWYSQPSDN